ncbi:hypothetical protein COCSADRAFT_35982 [Bipolaris sorokiniana ND90Pr]|uniref:Uncharacterized protein n=1 Tax=Cochliobolus sativus (strain ND90Pr / ATCC 201652) TaxID=665912 RepID=M2TA08_COCSN|nr:uncharacterized protein COCSADRAFT_35982 [Bipolaris sorokiniana ND90Pr]EMD66051.1 hypothetical protein COCSADRAFT_35982 [Bipolaris sorokiniana ND90Pr]
MQPALPQSAILNEEMLPKSLKDEAKDVKKKEKEKKKKEEETTMENVKNDKEDYVTDNAEQPERSCQSSTAIVSQKDDAFVSDPALQPDGENVRVPKYLKDFANILRDTGEFHRVTMKNNVQTLQKNIQNTILNHEILPNPHIKIFRENIQKILRLANR